MCNLMYRNLPASDTPPPSPKRKLRVDPLATERNYVEINQSINPALPSSPNRDHSQTWELCSQLKGENYENKYIAQCEL